MSLAFPLRPLAVALGLATALLVAGPSGAGAVDAALPAPCAGMHLTDPTGDLDYDANGSAPGGAADGQPNMDVKGLFFNYRPDKDGNKVLTANIQIANLDKTIPPDADTGASGGIWYYVIWASGDETRYVRAANQSGDEITYAYGTIGPNLPEIGNVGAYTEEGDTAGALFEGADGIVQIDVPADFNGTPGETLTGAFAVADVIEGEDDVLGFNHHVDWTPTSDEEDPSVDAPNGKDYMVAECPPDTGTGTTTNTTPTNTTTTTTTTPPTALSELPIRSAKLSGRARKARKGRKLAAKITSERELSAVTATLKKRSGKGKALASGKASRLVAGTSTVKMKLRRKLRQGRYALVITGTVDGRKLSKTIAVRLRK